MMFPRSRWAFEGKGLRWVTVGMVALCVWAPRRATAAGSFVEVGDILTANYYANRVRKVNPQTGIQQNLGSFTTPMDLALSPAGDLYVGELGGAIKRLTITNAAIAVVNPTSSLTSVRGLTLSSSGDLYVTGRSNTVDVVMRVNPATGAETVIAQGGNLSFPTGIELLNPEYLIVASFFNSSIVKVRIADGTQTVIASGGAWLDQPWGLAVSGDIVYAGHYDGKQINRFSAATGATSLLATAPGYPYGLGRDADGTVLVGAVGNAGQQDMLVRFSPQGVLLRNFSVGFNQQIAGIEVARFQIGVAISNRPPALAPVGNQTVDEGALLSVQLTATDAEAPPQTLTFTLGPGAPPGAAISPDGLFGWVPADTNGPGTYPITVVVTDDGVPPLSDATSFSVTVNDVPTSGLKIGDILAANNDGDALIKVDPQTGAALILGPFTSPTDVALSTNGFLYVSEFAGTITRLDMRTATRALVNSNSTLSDVWGLALGPAGELYVTSEIGDCVVRIDPDTGAEQLISEGNLLSGVRGIALLDPGHLVVASMFSNSLVSVAVADGAQSLIAADNGIDQPWGVAVAGTNLYVASSGSQTVQKVQAGQVETIAFNTEGSPMGLAVEDDGHILAGVMGPLANALARMDAQGTVLDYWTCDAIGQLTGLEVSSILIEPANGPLFLQASLRPEGPYADQPTAVFDTQAQTVTIAQSSDPVSFYRLRGPQSLRIVAIRIIANEVQLEYRLEP